VVSPDRTQLLGAIDQDGAFTRAAGEDHSGRQAFWLEYLEGRTGTEKFYLLGDGRYLLRKSIEEDGARIAILERGGDSVQEAYLICGPDGQVG